MNALKRQREQILAEISNFKLASKAYFEQQKAAIDVRSISISRIKIEDKVTSDDQLSRSLSSRRNVNRSESGNKNLIRNESNTNRQKASLNENNFESKIKGKRKDDHHVIKEDEAEQNVTLYAPKDRFANNQSNTQGNDAIEQNIFGLYKTPQNVKARDNTFFASIHNSATVSIGGGSSINLISPVAKKPFGLPNNNLNYCFMNSVLQILKTNANSGLMMNAITNQFFADDSDTINKDIRSNLLTFNLMDSLKDNDDILKGLQAKLATKYLEKMQSTNISQQQSAADFLVFLAMDENNTSPVKLLTIDSSQVKNILQTADAEGFIKILYDSSEQEKTIITQSLVALLGRDFLGDGIASNLEASAQFEILSSYSSEQMSTWLINVRKELDQAYTLMDYSSNQLSSAQKSLFKRAIADKNVNSIILHAGSTNSGHYISYVSNLDSEGNRIWYRCDDEEVDHIGTDANVINQFSNDSLLNFTMSLTVSAPADKAE